MTQENKPLPVRRAVWDKEQGKYVEKPKDKEKDNGNG
jgi:hypothetical protein